MKFSSTVVKASVIIIFSISCSFKSFSQTIYAGAIHSMSLCYGSVQPNVIYSWGSGFLGDATSNPHYLPQPVMNLTDVITIWGGYYDNFAMKSDSTLWAWGYNSYGELGDGTIYPRSYVCHIQSITNVIAMSLGFAHTVALKSDGTVWTWGWNEFGQLGMAQRLLVVIVPFPCMYQG
jgi:alpha-tubulin suppressor-like RCC1 family protein